ncbi:MAG: isoleucine--tRNA ligase [Oscillospiraceae bacterium]|nr:isoleucine--tRNA ligase [Oscillospiraceae bacterium]
MSQDYNNTLNLPKTDFPMRGNLTKKEPETLNKWESERLYYKMIEKNTGKPLYVLHDGPPYANGEIHLGTALNKILKDFIVKYKNMSGFCAPYVPGWDTHGLPIELKAIKSVGVENGAIPPVELRKHCKNFALKHVKNQMKQFKRLGSLGNYDDPYLTLKPEYEARQVEVFGKMAKDGYMYKGLKPVYWCPDCNTALAEAEIEYANDDCYSIYVKFNVTDDKGLFTALGLDLSKVYFVIWTTTTWTIPGNLAVCLGPEYSYTLVNANGEYYVMAEELVSTAMAAAKITDYTTIGHFSGKELEYIKTKHPLFDRQSPVIVGDHVTLESGTGCVHTAPGHGVEDYEVCKNYPEIGIIVPVDAKGNLTDEAGEFSGMTTTQANKAIAAKLEEIGALFAIEKIIHQYPHCWRCNSPIIFRATDQWFCSVNGFKDKAIKAIEDVNWIPGWGEDRIKGMVRDRSDWCISRQRTWGVPIPIIYCKECHKPIVNDTTIKAISDLFRKEGADSWWTKELSEFIPDSVKCECGCGEFTKEHDIMDVWFDSGVSHTAVMDEYDELRWPADLYLEGADQYRGWFQSSLLTSVVYRGTAPYKNVCTHGWVVDGQGRKMSKSLGNGITPDEIINQYGADILRLWVASSDYHSDIRISQDILKQLSDAYKKIRNTARFILGNISNGENGFDPKKDMVADDKLSEIDKWALKKLDELIDRVNEGYNKLDFHIVLHSIHNFCVTDMSNFYLDIIKDRLYCTKESSVERCAAQTAMYRILSAVARLIAPVMSFTAEEIWSFLPHLDGEDDQSIFLNEMPEKSNISVSAQFDEKWALIYDLRQAVNKALEEKRNEKVIGKSLEANVKIFCSTSYDKINAVSDELASIFIVSDVQILNEGNGEYDADALSAPACISDISVTIEKAEGEKCERCWVYSKTVGQDNEHPTLCARCAAVLK